MSESFHSSFYEERWVQCLLTQVYMTFPFVALLNSVHWCSWGRGAQGGHAPPMLLEETKEKSLTFYMYLTRPAPTL